MKSNCYSPVFTVKSSYLPVFYSLTSMHCLGEAVFAHGEEALVSPAEGENSVLIPPVIHPCPRTGGAELGHVADWRPPSRRQIHTPIAFIWQLYKQRGFGQNIDIVMYNNLYLYKYENVCLSAHVFLGHFETDWATFWHKLAYCSWMCF